MEFISALWVIPFLGIILSMSLLPLLCPHFWERHCSYVPSFWTMAYLLPVACFFGIDKVPLAILEPIISDYIPFVILISTLYIVSGGIYVDFPRGNGALFNTIFLFFGSIIAGIIGTTGAAALLIRPFLRANSGRKYKTHLTIFFIFLIANIGGAATPLGDPPLFIGFMKGIDFFWFIKHLYKFLFSTTIVLCLLFFIIDSTLFKKENLTPRKSDSYVHFEIQGLSNVILIIFVLMAVILCNFDGNIKIGHEEFAVSSMVRNFLLLMISAVSLKTTPTEIREKNQFSIAPIKEIAELFAGIFITVTPIINILHQGTGGAFGHLFEWIAPGGEFIAGRCFWISGMLSSILDNAPTFLIFFHLTSGDPTVLMTVKSHILTAFSISTVFMGAMTYIGNAPNLIVKSVALDHKIKMPSFLGYMGWSIVILVPVFVIVSYFL